MNSEQIQAVNEHAENRNLAAAWKIVDGALEGDPNDVHGLILASFLCEKEGKLGIGYSVAQRAVALDPNSAPALTNLGRMCDGLWRGEEAKQSFRKALARNDSAKGKALVLLNLSAVHVQEGDFTNARKYAEQCLEIDPTNFKARHNLGMCQLSAGEWEAGWKNYSASVGTTTNRPVWKYANEQTWQGEPDGTVVIYGEQGIGDEICAASMFPDAIKRAKRVVLECDARLSGLYRRSFPGATVYGTRNKLEVSWAAEDSDPDYSITSFQLGQLFRHKAEDFPGTPYLTPDPDRVAMWRGLWAEKKKPIIGVAWTGGTKNTAAHARRWTLEQLLPVFRRDAHFVCLQYTDSQAEVDAFAKEHGVDLKCYQFATLSKDYDDTAALVSTLDCVVGVPTSVIHLAGALGVEAVVTRAKHQCWKFAANVPFANKKLSFVNWNGDKTPQDTAKQLEKVLSNGPDPRLHRL